MSYCIIKSETEHALVVAAQCVVRLLASTNKLTKENFFSQCEDLFAMKLMSIKGLEMDPLDVASYTQLAMNVVAQTAYSDRTVARSIILNSGMKMGQASLSNVMKKIFSDLKAYQGTEGLKNVGTYLIDKGIIQVNKSVFEGITPLNMLSYKAGDVVFYNNALYQVAEINIPASSSYVVQSMTLNKYNLKGEVTDTTITLTPDQWNFTKVNASTEVVENLLKTQESQSAQDVDDTIIQISNSAINLSKNLTEIINASSDPKEAVKVLDPLFEKRKKLIALRDKISLYNDLLELYDKDNEESKETLAELKKNLNIEKLEIAYDNIDGFIDVINREIDAINYVLSEQGSLLYYTQSTSDAINESFLKNTNDPNNPLVKQLSLFELLALDDSISDVTLSTSDIQPRKGEEVFKSDDARMHARIVLDALRVSILKHGEAPPLLSDPLRTRNMINSRISDSLKIKGKQLYLSLVRVDSLPLSYREIALKAYPEAKLVYVFKIKHQDGHSEIVAFHRRDPKDLGLTVRRFAKDNQNIIESEVPGFENYFPVIPFFSMSRYLDGTNPRKLKGEPKTLTEETKIEDFSDESTRLALRKLYNYHSNTFGKSKFSILDTISLLKKQIYTQGSMMDYAASGGNVILDIDYVTAPPKQEYTTASKIIDSTKKQEVRVVKDDKVGTRYAIFEERDGVSIQHTLFKANIEKVFELLGISKEDIATFDFSKEPYLKKLQDIYTNPTSEEEPGSRKGNIGFLFMKAIGDETKDLQEQVFISGYRKEENGSYVSDPEKQITLSDLVGLSDITVSADETGKLRRASTIRFVVGNQTKVNLLNYREEVFGDKNLIEKKEEIAEGLKETTDDISKPAKFKHDHDFFRGFYNPNTITLTQEQEEKALEWYNNSPLKNVCPFVVIKDIITNGVAKWNKHGITLYNGSSLVDLYHEAFHAYTQGFLTEQERKQLYDDVRKKGSDSTFVDFNGNYTTFAKASDLQIEEFLAEGFRTYKLTGKVDNIISPAKGFFKRILDFLKKLFNGNLQKSINDLYKTIDTGKAFEGREYGKDFGTGDFQRSMFLVTGEKVDPQVTIDITNLAHSFESHWIASKLANNNEEGFNYLLNSASAKTSENIALMYGSMQLKCQEVAKKLKKEDNSHMSQAIRMLANNLIDVKNINGSFNTAVKDSKLHTLHGILPFLLSERTTGVKEIEEDVSLDEEEGTGSSSMNAMKKYSKTGDESSQVELAQKEILWLLNFIPKYKRDESGAYTNERTENALGLPEVMDWHTLFNDIANNLHDVCNFESLVQQLRKLAGTNPSIRDFIEIFKINEIDSSGTVNSDIASLTTEDQLLLQSKLYQTFNKYLCEIYNSVFSNKERKKEYDDKEYDDEDDDFLLELYNETVDDISDMLDDMYEKNENAITANANITQFNLASQYSNPTKAVYVQKAANATFRLLKDYDSTFETTGTVKTNSDFSVSLDIDTIKKTEEYNIVFDNRPFGADNSDNPIVAQAYMKLAKHVGIEFSNPIEALKMMSNEKRIKDKYLVLKSAVSRRSTRPATLRNDIKAFIAKIEFNTGNKNSKYSVTNAENHLQYERILNNTETEICALLNNVRNLSELDNIPELSYLKKHDLKNNPLMKVLFDDKGNRRINQATGEFVKVAMINTSGFSKTDTKGKRISASDMYHGTADDTLMAKMAFLTDGIITDSQHADKTTTYAFVVQNENSSIPFGLYYSIGKAVEDMEVYFVDHAMECLRAKRNLDKDVIADHNYLKTLANVEGEGMGFFAKIIEKDARKALNELLDSLESADNTKARNAISKFYKEHSDNNIRLQQRIIDYLKDWVTEVNDTLNSNPEWSGYSNVLIIKGDRLLVDAEKYVASYIMHQLMMEELMYGNTMQYNHAKHDFSKRIGGLGSTGEIMRNDAGKVEMMKSAKYQNSTYANSLIEKGEIEKQGLAYTPIGKTMNTSVVDDLVASQDENLIALYKELIGDKAEDYSEETITDGFGLVTFDADKDICLSMGSMWSKEQSDLFNRIVAGEYIEPSTVIKFFPVLKLQYQGNLQVDENLPNQNGMDKFCLYPLIPSVIKDTALEVIHKKMITENIHYLTFKSASKISTLTKKDGIDRIFTGENNSELIPEMLKFNDAKTVFTKNIKYSTFLKNQLYIHEEFEGSITKPTQANVIIEDNAFDNGVPVDFVKNCKDIDDAVDKWEKLLERQRLMVSPVYRAIRRFEKDAADYTQALFDQVLKDFGIEKVEDKFQIKNEVKFGRKLVELLEEETDASDAVIDRLRNTVRNSEDIGSALAFSKINLDKIISRIEKKIINQKVKGSPLVQVSSGLFGPISKESISEEYDKVLIGNDLADYDITKDELGEGIQVKISLQGDFEKLLLARDFEDNKMSITEAAEKAGITPLERLNQALKDEKWNKKYKDCLKLTSCRIPTQSTNSMELFTIKQFLPKEGGNIIVLPRSIVTKTGSDFDVDKQNAMYPAIFINADGDAVVYRDDLAPNESIDSLKKELAKKKSDTSIQNLLSGKTSIEDLNISNESKERLNALKDNYQTIKQEKDNLLDRIKSNELLLLGVQNLETRRSLEFESDELKENVEKLNEQLQTIIESARVFDKGNDKEIKLLQDKINSKSISAMSSRIMLDHYEILGMEHNRIPLLTPNSTDLYTDFEDELSDEEKALVKDSDTRTSDATKIFNPLYDEQKRLYNVESYDLLSIAATAVRGMALMRRIGAAMQPTFVTDKNTTKSNILCLPHNTVRRMFNGKKVEMISLSGITSVDKLVRIANLLEQPVSLTVDVAKGAHLSYIGIDKRNFSILVYLDAAGVPLHYTLALLRDPIVQEFARELLEERTNIYRGGGRTAKAMALLTVITKHPDLFPSGQNMSYQDRDLTLGSMKFQEETVVNQVGTRIRVANAAKLNLRCEKILANALSKGMFNDVAYENNNKKRPFFPKATASAKIAQFINLIDQSSALTDIILFGKADKEVSKGSSILSLIKAKREKSAKKDSAIPFYFKEKIMNESPISSFYLEEELGQISSLFNPILGSMDFNKSIADLLGFKDTSKAADKQKAMESTKTLFNSYLFQKASSSFDYANLKKYKGVTIVDKVGHKAVSDKSMVINIEELKKDYDNENFFETLQIGNPFPTFNSYVRFRMEKEYIKTTLNAISPAKSKILDVFNDREEETEVSEEYKEAFMIEFLDMFSRLYEELLSDEEVADVLEPLKVGKVMAHAFEQFVSSQKELSHAQKQYLEYFLKTADFDVKGVDYNNLETLSMYPIFTESRREAIRLLKQVVNIRANVNEEGVEDGSGYSIGEINSFNKEGQFNNLVQRRIKYAEENNTSIPKALKIFITKTTKDTNYNMLIESLALCGSYNVSASFSGITAFAPMFMAALNSDKKIIETFPILKNISVDKTVVEDNRYSRSSYLLKHSFMDKYDKNAMYSALNALQNLNRKKGFVDVCTNDFDRFFLTYMANIMPSITYMQLGHFESLSSFSSIVIQDSCEDEIRQFVAKTYNKDLRKIDATKDGSLFSDFVSALKSKGLIDEETDTLKNTDTASLNNYVMDFTGKNVDSISYNTTKTVYVAGPNDPVYDRFGLEKNQGALINLEIVKAIDSEGNLLDLSKPEIVSEFVKKLEQIKANKSDYGTFKVKIMLSDNLFPQKHLNDYTGFYKAMYDKFGYFYQDYLETSAGVDNLYDHVVNYLTKSAEIEKEITDSQTERQDQEENIKKCQILK